jgi:hypothetical protein
MTGRDEPEPRQPPKPPEQQAEQAADASSGKAEAHQIKGAPFEPTEINIDPAGRNADRVPRVPTGPPRGSPSPTSPQTDTGKRRPDAKR